MQNLLPIVNIQPILVTISLVKEEIYMFEIIMWAHAAHIFKGSSGFKGGSFSH